MNTIYANLTPAEQPAPTQQTGTGVSESRGGVYDMLLSGGLESVMAISGNEDEAKKILMQMSLVIRPNPKLMRAITTREGKRSLIGVALTLMALHLSPDPAHKQVSIVPYKDKITLIFNYGAIVYIARSQGILISAQAVYKNDIYESDLAMHTVSHKPNLIDRGEMIGAYAVAREKSNGIISHIVYKTKAELHFHGNKYAPGYSSPTSPWKTAFDEMAMKTVAHKVSRYSGINYNPRNIPVPEGLEFEGEEDLSEEAMTPTREVDIQPATPVTVTATTPEAVTEAVPETVPEVAPETAPVHYQELEEENNIPF